MTIKRPFALLSRELPVLITAQMKKDMKPVELPKYETKTLNGINLSCPRGIIL